MMEKDSHVHYNQQNPQASSLNHDLPSTRSPQEAEHNTTSITNTNANQTTTTWTRLTPVLACGAGLFSDGYLNGVIGFVSTMLSKLYPKTYTSSAASRNVSSITFAGTVLGMLIFGYTSDHYSRKWSLFGSTVILIVFAALGAGAYGTGSEGSLFAALTAWRFLLGVGIGGEYPAGSVGCAESSGELKAGTRNRWFILFTNVQIDIGFVVSALVPMIVVCITPCPVTQEQEQWLTSLLQVLATGESHLRAAWRICLGLGVMPPLSLLYLRLKLKEPEAYRRETMAKAKTPWLLVIKFYWWRLTIVSLIWFIYDFSGYSFSLFSSTIVSNLLGKDAALWKSFGWTTVIYLFYLPGCIGGCFVSDWLGPKMTLGIGVLAQGCVGFIMAGVYGHLAQPSNVAGFVIVYGLFLALGEFGPGNNIGLIASKSCATAVRGQYYGIAAAMGKIGAFVGDQVLALVYNRYADTDMIKAGQYPFFISSALCIVSAAIAFLLLPHIGQDTIDEEDVKFRAYLSENGYHVGQMGRTKQDSGIQSES
jgi:MFS family permease